MSRLRFLFSLVALVALATTLAACGGGDGGGGTPQEVVDEATLQGIDSGNLDLVLDVEAPGKEGGDLDLRLSGPFQGEAEGELPQLDMTAKVDGSFGGDRIAFDGGLVLLPNSAYVNYEGVDYEVDPTTFSFVEATLKEQQRQAGGEGEGEGEGDSNGGGACQEAVGELQVGDFIEDASSESDAKVGGTDTTKVSGSLDVPGALDALLEVVESPACSAQLAAAGPLPSKAEIEEAKGEVQDGVRTARVDVYVGEDDIVRRIAAQLKVEPQGDGDGPSRIEVDLDLKLTGVNEEQEISAPQGNVKPLNELFLKLGVNPVELLGLLQGEGGGEGLDSLLEGLSKSGGGGSGGGSSGGNDAGSGRGASSGGGQQAYLDCLQGARTPVDLQKCARILQ